MKSHELLVGCALIVCSLPATVHARPDATQAIYGYYRNLDARNREEAYRYIRLQNLGYAAWERKLYSISGCARVNDASVLSERGDEATVEVDLCVWDTARNAVHRWRGTMTTEWFGDRWAMTAWKVHESGFCDASCMPPGVYMREPVPTPAAASSTDRSTSPRNDDRILEAIIACSLVHLGESACANEVEKHLGYSLGGVTCSAFFQQVFGKGIDPGELALGAVAHHAASSRSEFWQVVGTLGKFALYMKCVDDHR